MHFSALITSLVPTLILVLTARSGSLPHYRGYHEVFGNKEIYLDLYFDANPRAPFHSWLAKQKKTFWGFMVKGQEELKVVGSVTGPKGHEQYTLECEGLKIQGRLNPGAKGCEPEMHLTTRGDLRLASQVLRAGFCLP